VPLVKSVIRAVPVAECEALFDEIRRMDCTRTIDARVRERVAELVSGAIPREVFNPSR